MTNVKEIRSKITSVQNTQNITQAMEMIAGVKMRKAQDRAIASRSYAYHLSNILARLEHSTNIKSPLTKNLDNGQTIILLIASNKGLCGGFNTSVFNRARFLLKKYDNCVFITVGTKASIFVRSLKGKILFAYDDFIDNVSSYQVWEIVNLIIIEFSNQPTRKVFLIFNRFVSTLSYTPLIRRILPLSYKGTYEQTALMQDLEYNDNNYNDAVSLTTAPYSFEPDEETVADMLLPRIIHMQIYQALLEAQASEHSARMIAMKNAKENTMEIVKDLKLKYNKSRQAAVTAEIIEIVSGLEALK